MGLGPVDVVAHYEVVAVEPHPEYDAQLIVEPFFKHFALLRIVLVSWVASLKALPRKGRQILLGVLVLRRDVYAWKQRTRELYLEIAALGYLDRVLNGIGVFGEEVGHLVAALHVELLGLEPHSVGIGLLFHGSNTK